LFKALINQVNAQTKENGFISSKTFLLYKRAVFLCFHGLFNVFKVEELNQDNQPKATSCLCEFSTKFA